MTYTAASEMRLHGPGFIYLSLFSSDDACQVLLLMLPFRACALHG